MARALLRLLGWTVVCAPPPGPKAVIVFYPHTSNLDFLVGVLARRALGLTIAFAAKDTLFRAPFGTLFRRLGGIPVNRRERTGFVTQLAARFAAADSLYLAIAPEGTRRRTDGWKSGFYHLAMRAGVPLGLGFIDYGRKEIGIGDWIVPSGDAVADTALLREFYAAKRGRHPAQAAPVRW